MSTLPLETWATCHSILLLRHSPSMATYLLHLSLKSKIITQKSKQEG